MAVHPHNLPDQRSRAGRVDSVAECAGCGYSLRGISLVGRCPECGLPIAPARNIDDPLSLMPLPVIRRFRSGCWLASACLITVIVMVLGSAFGVVQVETRVVALAVTSLLWVAGVFLLTPALNVRQGVTRGFSSRSRRRRGARWMQWAWVVLAGGTAVRVLAPNLVLPSIVAAALYVMAVVGIAGIVLLALQLEELAEWTCDRQAAAAFNLAVWTIPPASLLLILNIPAVLVVLTLSVLWGTAVATFPFALLSLSRSVTWATLHAHEHQARSHRRRRRDEEHERRLAARATAADDARS